MENNLQEQVNMKQVEELLRMGLMPVENIPWIAKGLAHMERDAFLPLVERRITYDFLRRILALVFEDQLMYRLVRQKIAMQKYRYEEKNPCWKGYRQLGTKMKNGKEVPNCVPISEAMKAKSKPGVDLKKTPEGMLSTLAGAAERKAKAGGKVSPDEKKLASRAKTELRRRRDNLNKEDYEKAFAIALQEYNIDNVSELSKEDAKEFLNKVEEIFNSNLGE